MGRMIHDQNRFQRFTSSRRIACAHDLDLFTPPFPLQHAPYAEEELGHASEAAIALREGELRTAADVLLLYRLTHGQVGFRRMRANA